MSRILYLSIFVVAIFAMIGCNGADDQDTGPEFHRVLPPVDEIPSGDSAEPPDQPDLDTLHQAVLDSPEDALSRFIYMNALDRAGRTDEALEQARQLGEMVERNPFRAVAYLNLARMVLDDVPEDAPNRSELVAEAIEGLNVTLELEPANIPAHKTLGILALETEDYDTALHHLAIALSVVEIGYELRIRMAEIYIEREDFEKAQAHLEAAKPLAEEEEDREAVRRIDSLMSRTR